MRELPFHLILIIADQCHGPAVTPDGSFYPCIQTAWSQRFYLGSLNRPGLWQRARRSARSGIIPGLPKLLAFPDMFPETGQDHDGGVRPV